MELVAAAEAVEAKMRSAVKSGVLDGLTAEARLQSALDAGLITVQDAEVWRRFNEVRRACIMVDDFPHDLGTQCRRRARDVSARSKTRC